MQKKKKNYEKILKFFENLSSERPFDQSDPDAAGVGG